MKHDSATYVSLAGIAELATIAETDTGTDTARVVTPDGLAGSVHGEKVAGRFDGIAGFSTPKYRFGKPGFLGKEITKSWVKQPGLFTIYWS